MSLALQNIIRIIAVTCAILAIGNSQGQSQSDLNTADQAQKQSDAAGKASQMKVSSEASATQVLLDEYRATLGKIENTKAYNKQVAAMIASQEEEMVSIKKQIVDLKEVNKNIVPLMLRMVDSLEAFVKLDSPFLADERSERILQLRKMMSRADVTTSEKYRRILEAYQVENEYGRTIEAYRGLQVIEGKELSVDFLRVGRVALIYQTLDGEKSGVFDPKSKTWSSLDSGLKKPIQTALRVARKQEAPNLLTIPVFSPEVSL
ncbi:MAG: DUF3450 domain-containing protein [Bdellovibrionales bacterium]|nr:DUF3450 domain-containing protein [Bdellovibrionales bacterium]